MGIRNRRSPEPELEVANRAAADPGNMDDNMVSSNSMADESTMGKVKGQIDLMARKTGLQVRKICLNMQNFEKGHFFIQESKKFFFVFHGG